ncbi:MAG: response regulator [Chitinophagaceae bacterium]|nr:response regulator [Chitinophagaceae bacterium]
MKIKIGIVEDEMIIAKNIENSLIQLGYDAIPPVGSYSEALTMIQQHNPDILLIDIQLSGRLDGIDLAEKVKEFKKIPFIFLTANSDPNTVGRAKEVHPGAYLIKPFNKEELYTSIEICMHNFATLSRSTITSEKENIIVNDAIFLKQGTSFQKIRFEDILFLESENVYVVLYTESGKYMVRNTLQNFLDMVNLPSILRIHRSFAVNITHLTAINTDDVVVGGRTVPLAKTYKDDLFKAVKLG